MPVFKLHRDLFSARAASPGRMGIATPTSRASLLNGNRHTAAEGRFKAKKLIACISWIFSGIHLQLTTTGDYDSNHAGVWLPDLEIEACVTIMLVITTYMAGKCCPRREGAMLLEPRYSAPSGKPLFQLTSPPSYIHSFLRRLFRYH
ncbi:hypothetical protein BCON_0101g00290 [Botryotinia convoluta]|uniref:Uncharacterized protein n=1 Tax=Botryotinia convoluta TaxID=54673 RepID=A0A4Z1IE19_9HELO|nr:hypothetical protein BCON_0101g00290 [Botryotinia convoluta]